jgi:adenosylhomocysteine nucleosidase
MNIVVLISANAEWRAVKEILQPAGIDSTNMGETFTVALSTGERDTEGRYFHGGWGKISAAATTQYVIDRWQPDLLVNLGTCGGFAGRISRGTIILAEKTLLYDIIEQMEDPDEAIAYYTTEMDLSWIDDGRLTTDHSPSSVVRGLLVSADRDIVAGEIEGLVEKYGAVAADWESGAIAWVAKRNGVRCLILRGVTDLVSPEGGEAYGDIGLFHENTKKVMQELVERLPGWIKEFTTKGTVP